MGAPMGGMAYNQAYPASAPMAMKAARQEAVISAQAPVAEGKLEGALDAGLPNGASPASAPMPMKAARQESVISAQAPVAEGKLDAASDSRDRERDSLSKRKDDGATSGGEAGDASPAALRSNFSETAFWQPHLLTGADGSATIAFTVPDSVTSWNVFVHAITMDLRGGSAEKETRTVKDLMVRPYVPRFLRESDKAGIKVVVNNASDKPLSGRSEERRVREDLGLLG